MAINSINNSFSTGTYTTTRNNFIKGLENHALMTTGRPLGFYLDLQGRLSIGYGVKLNGLNGAAIANQLNEFLSQPLSEYQVAVLDAYTQGSQLNWEGSPLNGQKITDERVLNELSTIQLKSAQAADLLLDKQLDTLENQLDRFLGDSSHLPASNERIAILSLVHDVFGSNSSLSEDKLGAIKAVLINNHDDPGQHARLWTLIKFGSNPENDAIAYSRRTREAELFSLFTDGTEPTDENEAKATAYVLREKYQTIDSHLSEMGGNVEDELDPLIDTALENYGEVQAIIIGADSTYRNDQGQLTNGNDSIIGSSDDDVIYGQGGNDKIQGKDGYDEIYGEGGNDELTAGAGDDIVEAGKGADKVFGGAGDDFLHGNEGDDYIEGNDGDDELYGEEGHDVLKGGNGFDFYDTDKFDTISDEDKDGEVSFDGMAVRGGHRLADSARNTFYGDQGQLTYTLSGTTLRVNNGLVIKDFKNGDLGIYLEGLEEGETFDDLDDDVTPGFGDSESITSPIIIDMDGDGVETLKMSNQYFDHENDGFAERTGWVGKDDALLVWDKDNNGKIEHGGELFGSQATLSSGEKAKNGYELLAELDDNQDGVIDSNDSLYKTLKIWQDKNSNAKTDDGELASLADARIKSISTQYTESKEVDAQGNEHRQIGEVTFDSGDKRVATDVWFKTNESYRVVRERIKISREVRKLPNARGYGHLYDLRQAMSLDSKLQTLVEAFVSEKNYNKRNLMILPIIYQWAGVTDVDPNSRDPKSHYDHVIDARKVVTLEKIVGRGYLGTWCWGERDPNPHGHASPVLHEQFNKFQRYVTAQLNAQLLFDKNTLSAYFEAGSRHFSLNSENLADLLQAEFTKGDLTACYNILETLDELGIYSSNVNKKVNKALTEVANKFDLSAFGFESYFLDLFEKGQLVEVQKGIEFLHGLADHSERIKTLLDVVFDRLLERKPELSDFINRYVAGSNNNDELTDSKGFNRIYGKKGNDRLNGQDGDDLYFFGQGDGQDVIYDSSGTDTIVFRDGIDQKNVKLVRDLTSVTLIITDDLGNPSGDQIKIENFINFDNSLDKGQVEYVRFADGSQRSIIDWVKEETIKPTEKTDQLFLTDDADQINALAGDDKISAYKGNDIIDAGEGNDEILAGDGDDTLIGGKGDDKLIGGKGSDTYQFSLGHGHDLIENANEDNKPSGNIIFDETINKENIEMTRSNDDLNIYTSDSDSIIVRGFFANNANSGNAISSIKFADDTQWSIEDIKEKLVKSTKFADEIIGYDGDDTFDALAGDDKVFAKKGNDIVNGGDGDDTLYGNEGNDTLAGDAGDDLIDGGSGNDVLSGGAGNDQINGGYGDDTLNGGSGNDTLNGGLGADLLAGGTGNDHLAGGKGNDTYMITRNEGNDTITDIEGDDTLQLTDINADQVVVRRKGYDLFIYLKNADEFIKVADQFVDESDNPSYAIDRIIFADNVEWDAKIIKQKTLEGSDADDVIEGFKEADVITAGQGNDTINGFNGNDQIMGEEGNDTLFGDQGDDELHGNAGHDTLNGGDGDDHLLGGKGQDTLHGGYGNDLLEGGQGKDKLFGEQGDDHLKGDAGADALSGGYGNDTLEGGDGNDELLGGEGQDTLIGGAGDDTLVAANTPWDNVGNTLHGGKGEDLVIGSYGDDTFKFNLGDGKDIFVVTLREQAFINLTPGKDTLEFGEGIAVSDLEFVRTNTNDLFIRIKNSNDQITVKNWFVEFNNSDKTYFKLNKLTFKDGSELSVEEVESQVVWEGTDGNDQFIGHKNYNETFKAGSGDDHVFTRGGDDIAYGEAGNDYLDGEEGNDQLYGGEGDDNIWGKQGNDQLFGGAGKDALNGNEGDDTLVGGAGDDNLFGGEGTNHIAGGVGSDKYNYEGGYDVIDNQGGGKDVLFFNNGIQKDDLTFKRDNDDLLIFVKDAAEPAVRVLKHFLGDDYAIDFVQPDAGSSISSEEINQRVKAGEVDGEYDAVVEGTVGDDRLSGTEGKDFINGFAGNDTLFGMNGDDILRGGAGDDFIQGGNGLMNGDDGNDILIGGAGNDILAGFAGNDTLNGGVGNDHYYYHAQGGQDVIDNAGGGNDWVFFIEIARERISYHRVDDDLVMLVDNDLQQKLTVKEHFLGGDKAISAIQPGDGGFGIPVSQIERMLTELPTGGDTGSGDGDTSNGGADSDTGNGDDTGTDAGSGDVIDPSLYDTEVVGTAQGEQLVGRNNRNLIRGLAGDDKLFGMGGDDILIGGDGNDFIQGGNGRMNGDDGNDTLIGGAGNDILAGFAGNDTLKGGVGNDHYYYHAQGGQDVIDNTGGGEDWVLFIEIARERISYHRVDDDLVMLVDSDLQQKLTITGHFTGGEKAISYIQPGDGGSGIPASQIERMLTDLPASDVLIVAADVQPASNINGLISAMASMTDGGAGEATVSLGASRDPLGVNLTSTV